MKTLIPLIITTVMLSTISKSQNISADFPFESRYLEVFGSQMHYVDEYADSSDPDQLTFLFLHGNPTSSYLWRNIIPYVKGKGRAVAPDLIGMGKSDKPDIDYTFQDHFKYLNEFISKNNLTNIVLVIHDWGSGLGFHYAHTHEENIKGIVFMEAMTRAIDWSDANMMERFLFKRMRNEKKGQKMIAENNFFINTFLFKLGTKRKLTTQEKAYYASPYPTIESRKPVRVWPQEIPFNGESDQNYEEIASYSEWLKETELPKLMIHVSPGMIIKKKEAKRIQEEFKNLETVHVGKGTHYIQEDHPHEIGQAIADWVERQKS